MVSRSDKIKAGAFVLVATALLVAGLGLLAGWRPGRSLDRHHILFSESVSGLRTRSIVRYQGVEVGRVQAIDFAPRSPGLVQVTIAVAPGRLPRGARARLEPAGLTGLLFVELYGGDAGGALLPASSVIESDRSLLPVIKESIPELLSPENRAHVSTVLESSAKVSARLGEVLEHNVPQLEQMLARLEVMIGRVDGFVAAAEQPTREMIGNLSTTATEIRGFVADNRQVVGELIVDVDRIAAQLETTLGRIDQFVSTNREPVGRTLARIDAIVSELDQALRAINATLASNEPLVQETLGNLRDTTQALNELLWRLSRSEEKSIPE